MPTGFVLTPLAERDVADIWDYTSLVSRFAGAADNIDAADHVIGEIERAFKGLARAPGTGHYREELADKRHRFHLVYSYLIVYRWQTKPMQVLRVLHAARDVRAVLGLTADD
jgi:plasmid stabilization system protein ParE